MTKILLPDLGCAGGIRVQEESFTASSGRESPVTFVDGGHLTRRKGTTMARVIPFYFPDSYKPSARWIPAEQRGKVIAFRPDAVRKTA
jgi:hypothetical protein